MSEDTELRGALVSLRMEWERKAKQLDQAKQGIPIGDEEERRLSTKAGMYRALALDLKRTVKDHPPTKNES